MSGQSNDRCLLHDGGEGVTIRDDARQEAERQYPALNPSDVQLTYPREAIREIARKAFERGAVWASEQADREPSEPVHVQVTARRGGKNSTLADMIVERANARGIRVEFVAPDREPSDAQVRAERADRIERGNNA